jgi:hypothetical protein
MFLKAATPLILLLKTFNLHIVVSDGANVFCCLSSLALLPAALFGSYLSFL